MLEFELGSKDPHEGYSTITNNFLKVVNKYAPLKKKTIRRNNAIFMKNFENLFTPKLDLKIKFLKISQNKMNFCSRNKEICV